MLAGTEAAVTIGAQAMLAGALVVAGAGAFALLAATGPKNVAGPRCSARRSPA